MKRAAARTKSPQRIAGRGIDENLCRRPRRLWPEASRRARSASRAWKSPRWSAATRTPPPRSPRNTASRITPAISSEGIKRADAVILTTPTKMHFRQGEQVMRAGKHVLVEIPVTDSVEDAENLVKIAKETGVTAMGGHVRRFNPSHQYVHKKIKAGELKIQQMDVQTYFFRRKNINAAGNAAQLDRPSAVAPRRPHHRPVPVPGRRDHLRLLRGAGPDPSGAQHRDGHGHRARRRRRARC